MPAKRKQTFAEIVSEVCAAPPAPVQVRAGRFNATGQFFDPAGTPLVAAREQITPAQAVALVASGALVTFEGCGCGGFVGGCDPQWIDADGLDRLKRADKPRFVKGFGSPTWIDHWSGEGVDVVFLHGDVEWGDEFAQ